MTSTNKRIMGLAVLALTLVLTAGLTSVYAHSSGFGFKGGNFSSEKYQEMTERREAMNKIFENNDYEAWKDLMEEKIGKMGEQINEETFSQMAEIHSLMQQGEYEQARELKQELGFSFGGFNKGRFGFHNFHCGGI